MSKAVAYIPADHPSHKIGTWLSAALDDPLVCEEMKADIRAWFEAESPVREPEEIGRIETLERGLKGNR